MRQPAKRSPTMLGVRGCISALCRRYGMSQAEEDATQGRFADALISLDADDRELMTVAREWSGRSFPSSVELQARVLSKRGAAANTLPRMRQRDRVELVERVLRTEIWTEEVVMRLMVETGASRPTIYRDRDLALARMAKEAAGGIDRNRAQMLQEMRLTRAEARGRGHYAAAVRLLAMEAKALGVDRAPLPEVEVGGEVDTSLEGVLSAVRTLRLRALAGSSFVAAEKLLEREVELVRAIQERKDLEEARNRAGATLDDLVNAFCDNAAKLPDSVRERLREALG